MTARSVARAVARSTAVVSASVNPTARSIYQKFALGDWWTCDGALGAAPGPLVGARNSTSAAKIGAGATSFVAGKVGNAIDVTAPAVYRASTLPFTPATGSTYALGLWVNPDTINSVCPLILGQSNNQNATDRTVQMILESTGVYTARAGNDIGAFTDASTAALAVATGSWYFLQAERGTNYIRCRVNGGSWVSAAITTNQAPVASQAITIGGDYNSAGPTHLNSFDGKFDEPFCLQGTLTGAELDYLYNGGAGISYAALKAAAGF